MKTLKYIILITLPLKLEYRYPLCPTFLQVYIMPLPRRALVNKSASWSPVVSCLIETSHCSIFSRTKLQCGSICLLCSWNTWLLALCRTSWFLHKAYLACGLLIRNSPRRWYIQTSSHVHCGVALCSFLWHSTYFSKIPE